MLHDRLIEVVAAHVKLLDEAVDRGVALDDVFELYGVLHALQVHAQAAIDYLLHLLYFGEVCRDASAVCRRAPQRGPPGGARRPSIEKDD
ncbi:hypothetical protein [Pyrobaculum ferrireducens]|uniref:Uncharacterized protein n=1 Tax=Pyrobaculum ferrireducens TaxID=1104324 RepID=G7VG74_9CREN|nr:hypothetical protein [Pyrobaculum ferrireducens]AET33072.1 hypothetical protein P186_1656 [Pyrobaculum ferrireducens]